MLIDGEKWACEACVRGHRVSNCQHTDRPLQHINKKGRPVSQCQHCRSMRKSRTAHVKCDCGEKSSKCAHLQPMVDGHRETCCCNHGGRCTCTGKKEPVLDTVPEVDSTKSNDKDGLPPRPRPPVRRRRAITVHSDGPLLFDKHGNYKSVHKQSKLVQKCGPYQLNRVNSMHSTDGLDGCSPDQFVDASAAGCMRKQNLVSITQQRQVKSEATSPMLSSTVTGLHQLNGQLPPLDLSAIEYPPYLPNTNFDLFGGAGLREHDAPMFSAGLSSASVDWSHIELADKTDSFAPSSYGQACSHSFSGAFDWGTASEQAPTLAATTSTSGEVSEVEDSFIPGDVDCDGFGTGDATFMRTGQIYSNGADLSSIDYDSFNKTATSKFGLSTFDDGSSVTGGSLNFDNDPLFWGQQFNDGITTYNDATDGVPIPNEPWNVQ